MLKLSDEEVIEYIENFLSGTGESWDWDDFTSITIQDKFLNEISLECSKSRDKFPSVDGKAYCSEEGFKYIKTLIQKIKDRKS